MNSPAPSPEQLHILGTYALATTHERHHGKRWYVDALEQALAISRAHRVPLLTVVGVIAALSPNNRWERNLLDAENLIRTFVVSPAAAKAVKVSTYGKNKEKAIALLDSDLFSLEELLSFLKGPKISAFACAILADSGHLDAEENERALQSVVIDGHAYSIWAGERLTMDQIPNIGVRLRERIEADYRAAASALCALGEDVTPSQVQAVTWVAHRRIHGVDREVGIERPGRNPHEI